ncbi:MAG TPA: dCMP deaminase family protein [Dehalococcoidia bacterium]|nr:dCMP deaminase family protein [Dehalococcoidia bacterium]
MASGSSERKRPDKFQHFLNRAKVVAERSTCLRRKIGAVIVRDGVEVASGYVGSPRGAEHCIDTGKCLRKELGIPPGERYELCRSVHAEQNAIINAARTGVTIVGGEMYISSERVKGQYNRKKGETSRIYGPCMICAKMIVNAGIEAVHMQEEGVGTRTYTLEDLKQILREDEERLRKAFGKSR